MWNNNSKPKTLKEFNLFKPISQQQQIDVSSSQNPNIIQISAHTRKATTTNP
jgi:hypothetical protein